MTADKQHWDSVYGARTEDELTWFEMTPATSLEFVKRHLRIDNPLIDIGAGASRLVDTLLVQGYGPLNVLDLSDAALTVSKNRLGTRASEVSWIVSDITAWQPNQTFSVWHDRAVFHFLTGPEDRASYARYSPEALARELNRLLPDQFEMIDSKRHVHVTPKGNEQRFQYSIFEKK